MRLAALTLAVAALFSMAHDAGIPTHILAELARRTPAAEVPATDDSAVAIARAATQLRSIFDAHPKQRALYQLSKAKRKATRKTRRAGATAGGVRELLARSIEIPGHRATYVTTTRIEARERAWLNDTASGFLDVLRALGTPLDVAGVDRFDLGGVVVEVREQELALNFSNGSRIDLFGADNKRAISKKRGNAKHVFWIDEAQDFRFLGEFYKSVISPALRDYEGETWLSGTPGADASGLFYDVTRDDADAIRGWEVHEIAVVDNPYFGHVVDEDGNWVVVDNMGRRSAAFADRDLAEREAERVRWENTAGGHIRENNLKEDDPDVQREWFARWVTADLAYVYPVHVVPKHVLVYAPQRLRENPLVLRGEKYAKHPRWYDHAKAVEDLPRKSRGRRYQWLYVVGADFGYYPDPFALTVWAFNRERPDVYEMFSWKCTRVLTDDQAEYLTMLWADLDTAIALVGDPSGKQDDFELWRQRLNLPIEEANKRGKNALEAFLADAIRANHVHYREDSPLLLEHRNLMYLPARANKTREVDKKRRAADGVLHGDHCADAGRYAYAHVTHYLFTEERTPDTSMEAEEREQEARIDRVEAVRKADRDDDGWEQLEEGYSQW